MKILIVGNGSTGIDNNKRFFINNHTGNFLLSVQALHDIKFVQNATQYDLNSNLQNFELKENDIEFALIKSNKNFRDILKLIPLIRKCDFVYIFYPGTLSRIVGLICLILRKNIGLYIRGQYYNEIKIDKYILKSADFILTVSPHFVSNLKEFCSCVEVISPMISLKIEDLFYKRNFLVSKELNLLFVGRVERRKGIYELLEITKQLKSRNISFNINIVGGGDLFYTVSKLIIDEDLGEYITLHGQVSDKNHLMSLYREANAFIFTSHDEGFPRVLYEAMANALPIFTTFVGGIPGRMIDGINCIEIPVKNGSRSAEIILNGLYNVQLMEDIAKKGQQTILDILEGEALGHEDLLLQKLTNL